jgi:hypothetical protein
VAYTVVHFRQLIQGADYEDMQLAGISEVICDLSAEKGINTFDYHLFTPYHADELR